jgi:tRNA(His) 5'-end guanylyltransferase
MQSLSERQEHYKSPYDYEIMRRLPIIISIDGRNFSKLSKNLSKPHSTHLSKVMSDALLYTITEVQGAVFGFTFADEVSIIVRNDQNFETEPWLNNKIQQIASSASSIFTLAFYKLALSLELELLGDSIFKSHVWAVPTLVEASNYIIYRQQECYKSALRLAANHEISKKIGPKKAFDLIQGKSIEDKIDLLLKYAGINFHEYYPSYFYNGIAAYRAPILIESSEETFARNKWIINSEIPYFLNNKDFLFNILLNGKDIIRVSGSDD